MTPEELRGEKLKAYLAKGLGLVDPSTIQAVSKGYKEEMTRIYWSPPEDEYPSKEVRRKNAIRRAGRNRFSSRGHAAYDCQLCKKEFKHTSADYTCWCDACYESDYEMEGDPDFEDRERERREWEDQCVWRSRSRQYFCDSCHESRGKEVAGMKNIQKKVHAYWRWEKRGKLGEPHGLRHVGACKDLMWHQRCELECTEKDHLCILCDGSFCNHPPAGAEKVQPSPVKNVCVLCVQKTLLWVAANSIPNE
jgi:hypothetical protein